MTLPAGFRFRPKDQELLKYYLAKKNAGEALPCGVVIERQIYGDGDKAPWQIFTDEDPWDICQTEGKKGNMKTVGTIYVLTTLIKAKGNTKRIARTAGCGTWHGETRPEDVLDGKGHKIGQKKMFCFQITKESGVREETGKQGHWIMHEYSLCDSKTNESKGDYVLCRISRHDSKDTKIYLRKAKANDVEAATNNDDVIDPKPAKRAKKELITGKKTDCNIDATPVRIVEQEESYNYMLDYDYDDSGNIRLTDEVVPLGLVSAASSEPTPIETSEDYGRHYLNASHISVQSLPHPEQQRPEELPTDQESDLFLTPITRFLAATEPSPISFGFSSTHVQQIPYGGLETCLDQWTASLNMW